MAQALCEDALFKAHLRADMEHDAHGIIDNPSVARLFGQIPDFTMRNIQEVPIPLAIEVQALNSPKPAGFENNIFTLFLKASGKTPIDFIIRNNTAMYPKISDPFKPFSHPNGELGIVYDAGKPLFRSLEGSWNLGNVGTIIDPASKLTRKEEDRYIWKPFTDRVDVSGCVFGFDSNVIGNVSFRSFQGTQVKCGITYLGKFYDLGTGNLSTPETLRDININARSGFLGGNNANAGLNPADSLYPLYFVGKALGDALQVYAISRYAGGLNPMTEFRSPASWARPAALTNTMISTNDKLNHARAVRLGVSTSYLYRAQEAPVTSCQFVLGDQEVPNPADLLNLYKTRFDDIKERVRRRYNTLTRTLQAAYVEKTTEEFGFDGTRFFQDDTHQRELASYFLKLRNSVVLLKYAVLRYFDWYTKESFKPEKTKDLARSYSCLNSLVEKLSPAGSLIRENGEFNRLKRIVMVCDGRAIDEIKAFKTYTRTDNTRVYIENGFNSAHYIHLQTDLEDIKAGRDLRRSPDWCMKFKRGGSKKRRTRRKMSGGIVYDGSPETLDHYPDPQIPHLVIDITNVPPVPDIKAYAVPLYNRFVCYLNMQNAHIVGLINGVLTPDHNAELIPILQQEFNEINIEGFTLLDVIIDRQIASKIDEFIFPEGDRPYVFSQFVDFIYQQNRGLISTSAISVYTIHVIDELVRKQDTLDDRVVLKDLIREAEEIVLLFVQPPQMPSLGSPPRARGPVNLLSPQASQQNLRSPEGTLLNDSIVGSDDSDSLPNASSSGNVSPPYSAGIFANNHPSVFNKLERDRSRSPPSRGGRRTRRKTPKVTLF